MKNLISLILLGLFLSISPQLFAQDTDLMMDCDFDNIQHPAFAQPVRDLMPDNGLRKAPAARPADTEPVCFTARKSPQKAVSFIGTIVYDKLYYAIFLNEDSYESTLLGWADSNDYYPEIVIPDEVPFEDMMIPVTTVNSWAFSYGWGITGVKFGKNIRLIGESSFYYTAIESLTIPSNVAYIDPYAFANTNLKTLEFEEPASVDTRLVIGNYAFAFSELTQVEIPARLTIGDQYSFTVDLINPFYGSRTLEKITINPAYKNINRNYTFEIIDDAWCLCPATEENTQTKIIAFPAASARKTFALEGGAVLAFNGALFFANNLESISLTATNEASSFHNIQCIHFGIANFASLKTLKLTANGLIGLSDSFGMNSPLLTVYQFSSGITNYVVEDGVAYRLGENKRRLDFYPAGKRDADFIVPTDVRDIYTRAFYSNQYLRSLTLPAGLKTIGDYTFFNCTNLESITMEDGAIEKAGLNPINFTAFLNNAPDGEVIVGKCLMAYKGDMPEDFVISPEVQAAASATLENYPGLRSLTFPENFRNIPDYFCSSCLALRHITWPLNLKSIGTAAFHSVGEISDEALLPVLTLPEGLETIGFAAFENTRLCASLDLPSTIMSVDDYAFKSLNWFTSVTIRSSNPPTSGTGEGYPTSVFNSPTINQGKLIIPIDASESDFRAVGAWNFVNIEHGNFSGLETVTRNEDGYIMDGSGLRSTDGSLMQLYRPDGSCVGSARSFDALPRGIYILRTTSGTHKLAI